MESRRTVVARLKASLEAVPAHNPNDCRQARGHSVDRLRLAVGDAFRRGFVD